MDIDSGGSKNFSESSLIDVALKRQEPQWLTERRLEAIRSLSTLHMPTTQLRPWKYTDVSHINLDNFSLGELKMVIENKNGSVISKDRFSEIVEKNFGRLIPSTEGKFVAANMSFFEDPIVIDIPDRKTLDEPIVISMNSDGLVASMVYPRLFINIGQQSEATIVIRCSSGSESLFVSGVMEIFAAQGANLRVLIDNRWGENTEDYSTIRSKISKDADVRVGTLAIGSRIFKLTVESLLEGEGAHSEIKGVALGDIDQHFDFVTLQDHIAPKTTSNVEIKSALAGSSKSIYYGITRVEQGALGAEANQENRNLLLSAHAKADSDPVLEILTADVIRCGHGATVGPVDEEALFYLQSRGLSYRSALQLIVSGFFNSVAQGFNVEGLEQMLSETVIDKIESAVLS
tara:strand:+ start:4459 stop:5667 length:1209 start_codon:yes stop_codon:yes gene_type:complete